MHQVALKEVLRFGLYTWLQGLAGTVFAQADVFLVAGLLGPDALTIYSVCQRLAMQIHSLVAAGSSFLFPFSSAAVERADLQLLRNVCSQVMSVTAIVASSLGITLFIFSQKYLDTLDEFRVCVAWFSVTKGIGACLHFACDERGHLTKF